MLKGQPPLLHPEPRPVNGNGGQEDAQPRDLVLALVDKRTCRIEPLCRSPTLLLPVTDMETNESCFITYVKDSYGHIIYFIGFNQDHGKGGTGVSSAA